jgi:hypothetical protein
MTARGSGGCVHPSHPELFCQFASDVVTASSCSTFVSLLQSQYIERWEKGTALESFCCITKISANNPGSMSGQVKTSFA